MLAATGQFNRMLSFTRTNTDGIADVVDPDVNGNGLARVVSNILITGEALPEYDNDAGEEAPPLLTGLKGRGSSIFSPPTGDTPVDPVC